MSKYIWNLDPDHNESAVRARRRARLMAPEPTPAERAGRRRKTGLVIGGLVLVIAVALATIELRVRAGDEGVMGSLRLEGARRYFGTQAWRRAHTPKKSDRAPHIAPANGGVG